MKQSASTELYTLTGMLCRTEEAGMRALAAREAELRAALRGLDDNRRAAATLPDDTLGPIRGVGGDILWQRWIGRNRAELNRALALCLAQKAQGMERLRRAHGRHAAAGQLAGDARSARRARDARHEMAQLEALILLQSSAG